MRAVYLLDFNAYSVGCEKIVENLPSDLSARVINTTNEKRQRERAFSYFLAYDLIKMRTRAMKMRVYPFMNRGNRILKTVAFLSH